MSFAADFWNRSARKYAASNVSDTENYDRTLARTRAYLSPRDRVREIGCGTGTTALKLAGDVHHITGSDYAEAMIAIAREKAAAGETRNVHFEVASADAPLAPESCDAVLAYNLLHLVADPGAVARVVARGLVPGGHFISKTFCFTGRWQLLRPVVGAMKLVGRAPSVRFFGPDWLEREIAAAGFEIVERDDHPWPRRFIVARRLDQLPE